MPERLLVQTADGDLLKAEDLERAGGGQSGLLRVAQRRWGVGFFEASIALRGATVSGGAV